MPLEKDELKLLHNYVSHQNLIYRDLLKLNIGYLGIIGFFSLSIYGTLSSYFFAHNYIHNTILHIIGLVGFIIYLFREQKNFYEAKWILFLTLIFLIGAYVYKNHDDFPYYHLTYALNLSENKFIVGTGIFSHGFRTFSSLFYFHSLLYMPYIKYYLFHIGPFLIIVFFNYAIFFNLLKNKKNFNITNYFSLLSVIFVNIVFYRLGEHGTDRSAQILLLLIFLFFIQLIYYEKKDKNLSLYLNCLLIFIFLASSMKAIYYMYLVLVPFVLFKKKFFKKFFIKKNFLIMSILTISLLGNITTSYFSTGCFLYPAEKTCIGDNKWSIPSNEVKRMKLHYEWWSKAGGGPGYVSEIPREKYVKNFTWFKNWVDRHFFNKVSDTLFGLIFVYSLIYFVFYYFSDQKNRFKYSFNFKNYFILLILPFVFLFEWFLLHPAMRYGGYVLIALPLIIISSLMIEKLNINNKKKNSIILTILLISIFSFYGRNIIRINKEIEVYNYKILESPYFYIEKVESVTLVDKPDFKVYTTKNKQMCWASKTPCSYFKDLKSEKFFGFNMVYTDAW